MKDFENGSPQSQDPGAQSLKVRIVPLDDPQPVDPLKAHQMPPLELARALLDLVARN